MNIRNAKISDAKAIYGLINYYAERDKMLFRSLADIYENLQTFTVAESDGKVVGCCALEIIWSDLAEIKSLAVDKDHTGRGIGRKLVTAALEKARQLGVPQVFALTLKPGFFEKIGVHDSQDGFAADEGLEGLCPLSQAAKLRRNSGNKDRAV